MKNVTRFAPSPTGKAHVGNIRTALFDYLAARSSGGKFYLRIEDTDRERFVPDAVDYIHAALDWLNLKHDGEVVYQSDRLPIYQKYAKKLIEKGHAYKCFCSPERLEGLKEQQEKEGKAPMYDRHCLGLSKDEIAKKEEGGEPFVIRFKIPETPKSVSWDDKVRGNVSFETNILEDFIILKSDGWPTYNLAHIIDDHEQEINLVIRGEEFVPSTPKYILVHEALGWKHPDYAHMPLTIGKDRKKLSKRHGDTAILDYKEKGYLPEAMVNFLALLGWNPGGGSTEEIFSLADLEKAFKIEDVNKAPAVFDLERLDWMNGVWIRKLAVMELADRIIDFSPEFGKENRGFLEKIVAVEQSRLKTLAEFAEISRFYFKIGEYNPDILIFKKSSLEATREGLEAVISSLEKVNWDKFDVSAFDDLLKAIVSENSLSNADVFWPVRAALSGLDRSPSPAELLWVFGKEESQARLRKALTSL
jgi:glutamyl-tRNA synthetase